MSNKETAQPDNKRQFNDADDETSTQQLNRKEAERFLEALDPDAEGFTFQTFDDDKDRKEQTSKNKRLNGYDALAKVFSGSLNDRWDILQCYNLEHRAGIFITINETNLKGRKTSNIVRVRALFVDLDGSPLEPVLTDKDLPEPHIIVETSPRRWHVYWLVDGMKLEDFTAAQKILIARYHSDPAINDLPRVMRLPGFLHQKGEPYLVKIHTLNAGLPYKADQFLDALAKIAPTESRQETPGQQREQNETQRLNTLALKNLSAWVPKLFPDAKPYNGGYRVTSAMLGRDLEEDLGIMPDGIKDFGLRDQTGEQREGRRTAIDIVITYGKMDYPAAVAWLREQLGLPQEGDEGVSIKDFFAYMPQHNYMYAPTRELWPASSVDARLGSVPLYDNEGKPLLVKGAQVKLQASKWLDQNKSVEQITWAPGMPLLIKNRLISEGGWIERDSVACFNLYRPPRIKLGDAAEAGPWVDHAYKIFPDEADHIITWLAHRVQRPEDKINHALVFGGSQGIGKDTLLEPVKYAVGAWNFREVSPGDMLDRYNDYLRSVILRVSEGHDLGDFDRYQLYEHMKIFTAAPPDILRVNEKHIRQYYVLNLCGVIITTNHKTDGIYLPPDDRRHFVAWSDYHEQDFEKSYWNQLWDWYKYEGGIGHVAAFLAQHDIKDFDSKKPPPKTPAWWAIVDASRAPEDAELADALDSLGEKEDFTGAVILPNAVTLAQIKTAVRSGSEFAEWLADRRNRRTIPYRLETCGYVPVRNEGAQDGYFVVNGARQPIYARKTLSIKERHKAAEQLVKQANRSNR